ncbi:MAG: hypothetical protein KDH94_00230 [Coxiellaceae bacterium]|nr:hypothetical protein [Coxiellaceae bacterium]
MARQQAPIQTEQYQRTSNFLKPLVSIYKTHTVLELITDLTNLFINTKQKSFSGNEGELRETLANIELAVALAQKNNPALGNIEFKLADPKKLAEIEQKFNTDFDQLVQQRYPQLRGPEKSKQLNSLRNLQFQDLIWGLCKRPRDIINLARNIGIENYNNRTTSPISAWLNQLMIQGSFGWNGLADRMDAENELAREEGAVLDVVKDSNRALSEEVGGLTTKVGALEETQHNMSMQITSLQEHTEQLNKTLLDMTMNFSRMDFNPNASMMSQRGNSRTEDPNSYTDLIIALIDPNRWVCATILGMYHRSNAITPDFQKLFYSTLKSLFTLADNENPDQCITTLLSDQYCPEQLKVSLRAFEKRLKGNRLLKTLDEFKQLFPKLKLPKEKPLEEIYYVAVAKVFSIEGTPLPKPSEEFNERITYPLANHFTALRPSKVKSEEERVARQSAQQTSLGFGGGQ